ncbi:MAG: LysR family transcriptional regulator [Proteobacteria bacterium]|nr:LysR family transcriptional regulator [Pseudomonadota bacterium]
MQPDLNRLRVFYFVHSRLSITEAANELHITASAVSQQIKKLEEEIHASLFTRRHKRLVPTSAGKRLFRIVAPLIDGLNEGLDTFEDSQTEPAGLLRIGLPVEFGSIYFPHVISSYRNRHPKVTFELELGRSSTLIPKVESGDLDVAFVDTFPTRGQYYGDYGAFSIKPLIEEEVVLACSNTFNQKFLGGDHTYGHLIGQSYISQERESRALHNWFRHHFGKTKQSLNIVLTVANHQAVLSAVRHHVGLGIIVSHLVWEEIQSGRIIVIKGHDEQAVNRISMVQLLDKVPALTEKSFIDHFETMILNSKTLGRLKLRI